MSERNLFWILGIAATTILGLAVAVFSAPSGDRGKDYENVRLLVDVLHEARDKYVTEITPDRERKLVEDMINGGLEHLDPHSTYINPKEWKQFNDHSRGKFGGIGVQIGYDRQVRTHVAYTPKEDGKWSRHSTNYSQERLSIVSCMPDSPASKAGIVSGDLVLKIAGKSTANMPSNEAIDLIKGEPDQILEMTVLHPGSKKPVDVKITRAIIEVKTVLGDLRKKDASKDWDYFLPSDKRIGYLRLTGFGEESTREMLAALKELKDGGMRGLILDLRNNPGGLLNEAVSVSNLFLPAGSKIVTTKGRNRSDAPYVADTEQRLLETVFRRPEDAEAKAKVQGALLLPAEQYPVVILVNRYSASAAEIVAAALQDHQRAIVVGERSFGKGSVQDMIKMENGTSRLKLTTASYWRPSGKNIHRLPTSKESDEWGVSPTPGYEVVLKDSERIDYLIGRNDRDIYRAAGQPLGEGRSKKEFKDRVLAKAVECIKQEIDKEGLGGK